MQVRIIFPHISLRDLPCHKNKKTLFLHQVSLKLWSVVFVWLQQKSWIRTYPCSFPQFRFDMLSVANFDAPPRLDSWCGLSLPLARTQCRHQLRNGKCVNSCCSTSASLGNTRTIPGLAGRASAALAASWSKPTNTLTSPGPDCILADVPAISRYTPPARSNSIRLPLNSLRIVPLVLRNVMILPLSHTCHTEIIDLFNPVFLGAICKSLATLRPCRVRKQIVALPVVVN